MLTAHNLTTYYDRVCALKGISFEVTAGEIVSFIGSNGAGKSTTLMTISGINKVSEGSLFFEGEQIHNRSADEIVSLGISQVPEGRHIFYRLSVKENLILGAYLRSKHEVEESLEDVYEIFPRLKEREKQAGGTLSGGEQQMLAIGRALMAKPKLLLLDEPSLGLAPLMVEKIFETIVKLNKLGITIILVEQNAMLALQTSHRGYVLERGNIIISGNSKELLSNDAVRKAYLGE